MGEVYRAHDMRLARDVALKVLPEAFAADAERMARFEREAKVLASLNHPNIASIYGLEESNHIRALVMELVEGPTLAERIELGAIPVDEALPIAKQVCEGLEYAHERGIIHRDLKPANVKLTPEGQVKILDFGLAKALDAVDATAPDPASSPTITRLATHAGIILGTAAYMSPEQAKGKAVDRRADIWAFGCVLYEMLAGRPAFEGETATDVLAAVVMKEPDWSALPATTPHRVRGLLQRCLTKDPRQRLRDIGEARVAIDRAASGPEEPGKAEADVARRGSRHDVAAWSLVGVLALIGAGLGAWILIAPRPPTVPAIVSEISPPTTTNFAPAGPPVLSPDGQRLAFAAVGSDGKTRLWVRPLNTAAAQPLDGTDGATFPFWSPDGRSLGFFANEKLNRIDASGGPPLAIADAVIARGGSWGPDGTILFTPDTQSPIFRVPASGGTPQPVTKLNALRQEVTHRWPQFLPDGKHFLFYAHTGNPQNNGTYAASLDGGQPKLLLPGDSNAVYAPPGYLLFVRQGALLAQRFDASSLRLIGDAVPLAENAAVNSGTWRGNFTVSENGILVYEVGSPTAGSSRLLWYDRDGKQIAETGTLGDYGTPSLSPDGRKLAVVVSAPSKSSPNIWVFDLARGIRDRLTFSSAIDAAPSWSPDGKTIVFQSNRSGQFHLYQKAADGAGSTSPLVLDNDWEYSPSFSSDGRYLIFERHARQPGAHTEIQAMPLSGDRKAFPVVQNQQFNVTLPALSPDGKWLAYVSPESGRREIYIVTFPHGTGRWEVSPGGGDWPRWRHDGKELFYISPDNKIMSAEISEHQANLVIGKVQPLFQTNPDSSPGWLYDVSPNGKQFVVATQGARQATAPLTLVVNWPSLLKKQ
jgi:serine/threonine protein kinase/Tol biopolymer transport system component